MMKNKIKLDIFFFIIINLMIMVLINDYLTFFLDIDYLFSVLISGLMLVPINFFMKDKISIYNNISKYDLIFYMILLCILVITLPYADRTFDTYNYHLYLQENPFGDKLFTDFFAGKNFNTYTYAFSDRLFYFFRYFLGYRLGVILNYFLLIILFYQVKRVFSEIFCGNANNYITIIFSTAVVLSLSIVDIVDRDRKSVV